MRSNAAVERPAIRADDVDAAGLGVDGVGEVAAAGHAEDAARLQERRDRRADQVLGQHDAVVDVDAVRVDRDVQRVDRLQHEAEAVVGRFLGLERLGAERDRGGIVTANVRTSNGDMPPMKLVAVDWKNCCCSDGARKPVDTVPRSATASVNA